jgi:hypothetical protein
MHFRFKICQTGITSQFYEFYESHFWRVFVIWPNCVAMQVATCSISLGHENVIFGPLNDLKLAPCLIDQARSTPLKWALTLSFKGIHSTLSMDFRTHFVLDFTSAVVYYVLILFLMF